MLLFFIGAKFLLLLKINPLINSINEKTVKSNDYEKTN